MVIPSAKPPTTGPGTGLKKVTVQSLCATFLSPKAQHTPMGRAKEAAGPALVWDSILPPAAAAEVGEQAEAVSPNSGLNQAGREC